MIPKCTEIQRVEVCNMPYRQRVLYHSMARANLHQLKSPHNVHIYNTNLVIQSHFEKFMY